MELIDEMIEGVDGELMAAAREGHLCVKREGNDGVKLRGDEERFEGLVGRWREYVYLQKNWVLEGTVVREFKRLLGGSVKRIDMGEVGSLNEKQREGVQSCLSEGVVCLTGGPGTGKTYVISEVVKRWGRDVSVCAPTGKAVSLLREKLDVEVGTLHGMLGIRDGKEVLFGGSELEYGMVIVDECSMIDVGMWGALLRNVKKGTRLILVGDHDQLPPVEAGTVFGELCRYMKGRGQGYVHLDECMRSDRKEILEKAALVRSGKGIEHGALVRDIKGWKDGGYQILSCLRRGPFGVETINDLMWEEGEIPIMITRSDRRLDLKNGEMGILIKKGKGRAIGKEDLARFGEREFSGALLPEYEPAYCISVHKSQGSEFKKVVLLVPKGSEVFGREILYTGITRAKEEVVVLAEEGVIEECVKRGNERMSGIGRRLCES
ncbi:MAG: AAA family ATPase [Chlamydiia bacterium]|nr:AAA family ATPase [Chlamydiia bacterium]